MLSMASLFVSAMISAHLGSVLSDLVVVTIVLQFSSSASGKLRYTCEDYA